MNAVDAGVMVVLVLASLRGLWIGLVREALSLVGLAVACVAARAFAEPGGAELAARSGLEPWAAQALAALVAGIVTLVVISGLARMVHWGVKAAGLGPLDRLGGGVLGAAEGPVIAALLLVAALFTLGPSNPWLRDSRSVELFESLEDWAGPRLTRVAWQRPRSTAGD